MFKPENKKTTYSMLVSQAPAAPRIVVGTTALKWIKALVDLHTTEVGFFGVVDVREEGTENQNYFIRDIFYPMHSEVHGATCEISEEGSIKMMQWLFDKGRDDDVNKVKFWGHSHVNMGVGPSGQDETQALERMVQTNSYVIRAIANKKGEMSISFFDPTQQIRYDHIKWEIEDDSNNDILNEKLTQIGELINNEEVDPKEKLIEMFQIIQTDDEVSQIHEKIEELKKVNLPAPKTYHHNPHYRHHGSYNHGGRNNVAATQTNMFNPNDPGFAYEDEFEDIYGGGGFDHTGMAGIHSMDMMTDEEVDKQVQKWHEGA